MKKGKLISMLLMIAVMLSAIVPVPSAFAQDSQTVLFDSASGIGDCVVANTSTSIETLHENNMFAAMKKLSSGAELGKVETLDLSAYGYINMWVYSPSASSGKFTLDIYNIADGTQTRTGRTTYTADWQGWKLISTALDTMADVDWSAVTKWRLTTYSTGSSWNELADAFLGIEKVWTSAKNPYSTESAETYGVVNYDEAAFTPDTTTGTFGTDTKVAEKNFGIKVDKRREGFFRNGNLSLTPYTYLNMWINIPADTVVADTVPVLRLRIGDSSGTVYNAKLNVDWTGWKFVSMPISSFTNSTAGELTSDAVASVFRIVVNETDYVQFNTASAERIYFDQIWFSANLPDSVSPALISQDGDRSFFATDEMLVLSFDETVTYDEDTAITLTDVTGAKSISVAAYQTAPDKITVKLDESLSAGSEYSLTLPYGAVYDNTWGCNAETVMSFTTEQAGIVATAPEIYNYGVKLGGDTHIMTDAYTDLRARTVLYNTTDTAKEAVLYIAVYDTENNTLEDIACTVVTANPNTMQTVLSDSDGYAQASSGNKVRCFIWETESMKPIEYLQK